MIGELAEELRAHAGLRAEAGLSRRRTGCPSPTSGTPKSPWHDRRVRLAANLAIDRQAINQARDARALAAHRQHRAGGQRLLLGAAAVAFDPARAKKLLAEAGYPNGFDAGDYYCDMTSADARRGGHRLPAGRRHPRQAAPAGAGGLQQERRRQEAPKNLVQVIAGVVRQRGHPARGVRGLGGTFAVRRLPRHRRALPGAGDELDRARREAMLHRVQQLVHERAMFAPIYELAFVNGVGRASRNPASASSPATRSPRPTRT